MCGRVNKKGKNRGNVEKIVEKVAESIENQRIMTTFAVRKKCAE